jgi:TRAP-type C4-dicarboxylate transport system permease small subunit
MSTGGADGPAGHPLAGYRSDRVMNTLVLVVSRLFGAALVGLSVFVSIETIARKAFNFSFQGADELGGYVLAVGSSLAFFVALVDRAHIRIDVLHVRFPQKLQATMDWLSIVSIAGLGLFMIYVGRIVIVDTLSYGSTAATPWATPLIYPQSAWYAALCLFALMALYLAGRATWLFVSGRRDQLLSEFHPKGTIEELEEELSDLENR